MRLLLTCYQKSGTHQIMPPLEPIPDIIDRSGSQMVNMPEDLGFSKKINPEGAQETYTKLTKFPHRAFGHIAYLPEYAEAVQHVPTKVIFNVRDPRDVIVSEYYNIKKAPVNYAPAWLNFDYPNGKRLWELDDKVERLIEFSALRWPRWLGWLQHDWCLKVKYEDLRLNGLETLQKIWKWAQPHVLDDPVLMLDKIKPRRKNPTFRRGTPGEWKELFTPSQKQFANMKLKDIILQLGYEL